MEYISNQLLDHAQILNLSFRWLRNILQILKIKTTSIGKQPRIIKKKGKSHQPIIGSCFNFKLKLRWPNLKILKVECLSKHLLDHTQILNVCLDDQIIFRWSNYIHMKSTPNGRRLQNIKSGISQQPLIGS